ncbi:MAG: CotH kinase family protein, partial [Lachnospiraceae bacterium]|nr:CotH kinase family protein [Lachnospiraceae bacterium]
TASATASAGVTEKPVVTVSELVGDVTFSKASGVYDSAFDLAINSAKGETVYYTTDGSDPRVSDTRKKYESPINIYDRSSEANVLAAINPNLFETMNYSISGRNIYSNMKAPSQKVDKCFVVKAASVGSDGQASDVVTNTYFVGTIGNHINNAAKSAAAYSKGLAIMSISFKESDLFDEQDGIYMKGKYFAESLQAYLDAHNNSLNGINVEGDLTANFKQRGKAWEKPCHIDYFETDGTTADLKLSQDCGIRIQGNYSRECIQKSFRLYARADYGEEYGTDYIKKNFKYPFFDNVFKDNGELLDKYKTIVLRDGGNDYQNYKYKDILMQSFADDLEVQNIHGRPCVVYLDGEYWGYYVMQDDISDKLLGDLHDVDSDSVLSYKATDLEEYKEYGYKLDEGDIPKGENVDYYLAPTLDYLKKNDMADENNYNTFMSTYMSENSVVDYFALELYLGNRWDWPGKNWQIWKATKASETSEYADDKWRFCLNDLDLTTEPTWSQSGNSYTMDVSNSLYNASSDNVLCIMFTNLIKNETFREKLYAKMLELSENEYSYSKVSARASTYKTMYSSLFDQCNARFLFPYSISEANHNANLNYIMNRPLHIDSVIKTMRAEYDGNGNSGTTIGYGDFIISEDFEEEPFYGTEILWEGSWTRNSTKNIITKASEDIEIFSDSANYIRITNPESGNILSPVITVSVAAGYGSNARLHIWDENKTVFDKYFYENEEAWIDKKIELTGIGKGDDIYLNVENATMVKIVVTDI